MRPVLLDIAGPSLLIVLAITAGVALLCAVWLLWLRRKGALTREHWMTAITGVAMAAIVLVILNRLGEIRVNSYGAMLMLGFLAGTYSAVRLGRRRGVPAERLLDLGLVLLVSSVIGARIMYLILTPNAGPFIDLRDIAHNGLGGLSFHGGLLGGLIAGSIYIFINRLNYWRVVDSAAPAVAVGYAITRIGCFLNGCCYGKPCNLPWAMSFPHSPDPNVINVHPTQLYASLMGFAMFGILLWLSRGQGLGRAGRLFMTFLMLEGVERFVMEIYRHTDVQVSGLTAAQLASIAIIIAGAIGWFLLPKQPAVIAESDTPNAGRTKPAAASR